MPSSGQYGELHFLTTVRGAPWTINIDLKKTPNSCLISSVLVKYLVGIFTLLLQLYSITTELQLMDCF